MMLDILCSRRWIPAAGAAAILVLLLIAGQGAIQAAADEPLPEAAQDAETVADGRRIFAQSCGNFECHQNYGGGGLVEDARKINDNKWYRSSGSYEDIVTTVTNGIPGTAMAPWAGKLPPERIRAVAAYVYLLSRGLAPKN
jgi:mono/diheme cytochrome c family protein